MSIVSFTIDGRSYALVPFPDLTLAECRELKRISGMTPLAAEDAMGEVDPDAWCAMLLISMRRVDPSVRDTDLEEVRPVQLLSALAEAVRANEEADAVPPTPISTAGGGKASSRATTRAVSGT